MSHSFLTFCFTPIQSQHFKVNYLALKIDNTVVEPALRPEWSGTGYLQAYIQVLKSLRVLNRPELMDITMDRFERGPLCVFGWNLSQDLTDGSACKRGVTTLDFTFKEPVPRGGVTACIYGQFHGMITVDGAGNVETYDHIYK